MGINISEIIFFGSPPKHCWFHTDQLCWFMPTNSAGFIPTNSACLCQPNLLVNQFCWFHTNQLCLFMPTKSVGLCQSTLQVYTNQLCWLIPTNSAGLYQPTLLVYTNQLCVFHTNRLCNIDEQAYREPNLYCLEDSRCIIQPNIQF